MRRQDNPEMSRKVLGHLSDLYHIKERREPNHLSTYVYCLTKGFLDQQQAVDPTDEEVMLFALGYALQDVLTPKDADTPVYELDGIMFSPDMSFARLNNGEEMLGEIKTTRRSAKKHYTDDAISDTWRAYMLGGCKIRNTTKYVLVVLYLMGSYSPPFPQLYSDIIKFDQEEIDENWERLLSRKDVLDTALEAKQPPTPYQYCYAWESKVCRYKLVCDAITQVKEG